MKRQNMSKNLNTQVMQDSIYPDSKTPGSTSIRYRSDVEVSDRYEIDMNSTVFVVCV